MALSTAHLNTHTHTARQLTPPEAKSTLLTGQVVHQSVLVRVALGSYSEHLVRLRRHLIQHLVSPGRERERGKKVENTRGGFSRKSLALTPNWTSYPDLPCLASVEASSSMALGRFWAGIWVSPQMRLSRTASWMNPYWSCREHSISQPRP